MKYILCCLWLVALTGTAATPPELLDLAKPLEPLRPFLEKTWKGAFANSTPEKPVTDISRWERALNGTAVRILHSINDGEYGGETIIVWNQKAARLEYRYYTTAGFFTDGTILFDGGKMIAHEKVTGAAGGVTEVKAVAELMDGKKLRVVSKYLKNGEWVDGRSTLYEEAPDAKVRFK